MQQIGGCHRYRIGERCYILLLITICEMVTYPASNPYSVCFPVFPFFILCQLGLLLKNAQCFSAAYRNRVTHLCLAPKAFPYPGPADCPYSLLPNPCPRWAGTISVQRTIHSQLWASPLPSSSPPCVQCSVLWILRSPHRSGSWLPKGKGGFLSAGAHSSVCGFMLCCHCLETLNHFWTRGPTVSFCTELRKLCLQACGGELFVWATATYGLVFLFN